MLFSLKYKILVSFSALVIGSLVLIMLVVNHMYLVHAMSSTQTGLKRTQLIFDRLLSERNRHLTTNARLLALDFALKQAVATADSVTTLSAARNHRARIGADLFIVTDRYGMVIADTSDLNHAGRDLSNERWIQVACAGGENSNLAFIDASLYQLISLPLLAPDVIGTLSLGFLIDDNVAAQLRQITQTEVSFLVENHIIASTWKDDVRRNLEQQLLSIGLRQGDAGDPFQLDLAVGSHRERYLSILRSIDSTSAGSKSITAPEMSNASRAPLSSSADEVASQSSANGEITDTSEIGADTLGILNAFGDGGDISEASDAEREPRSSAPNPRLDDTASTMAFAGSAHLLQDHSVVPSSLIQGSLDAVLVPLKTLQRNILMIGLATITISIGISLAFATGITSPVRQLVKGTEEVVKGNYEYQLNISRRDEIGQLAEHFRLMVSKVYDREKSLKKRVAELEIVIDEEDRQKQVEAIVDTEFFGDLQQKARLMRTRLKNTRKIDKEHQEP